ncbi:MAG: PEP-utilizing enzyme [Nanoarchaeota archaeon]|nr:PEP-utilizing enzyme [Nanoarchaeota archaeon]
MNENDKFNIEGNKPWVKIWAGTWSLSTCSHFGEQYTRLLDVQGMIFMDEVILIVKEGKSSAYVSSKSKDKLGNHLSKIIMKNPKKINGICNNLKKSVDKVLKFIDKYEGKEIDLKTYQKYWKAIENYYPNHIAIKYAVDYVSPDFLKKYLHEMQEARLYAEPVFTRSEEFMIALAKIISKNKGYRYEYILCLMRDEIYAYLKNGKLPNEKILEERYKKTCLIFNQKNELILNGNEVDEVERIILKEEKSDVIKGQTAYPGHAKGTVRIILDPSKAGNFNEGDILVTGMTRPEYLALVKKASAFVTDAGGVLSHAAIVARELKKPCVIGTQIATKVLKDGMTVEVDADKGIVRILK